LKTFKIVSKSNASTGQALTLTISIFCADPVFRAWLMLDCSHGRQPERAACHLSTPYIPVTSQLDLL